MERVAAAPMHRPSFAGSRAASSKLHPLRARHGGPHCLPKHTMRTGTAPPPPQHTPLNPPVMRSGPVTSSRRSMGCSWPLPSVMLKCCSLCMCAGRGEGAAARRGDERAVAGRACLSMQARRHKVIYAQGQARCIALYAHSTLCPSPSMPAHPQTQRPWLHSRSHSHSPAHAGGLLSSSLTQRLVLIVHQRGLLHLCKRGGREGEEEL